MFVVHGKLITRNSLSFYVLNFIKSMDDKCRRGLKKWQKKKLKIKIKIKKKQQIVQQLKWVQKARFEHTINDNLYILVEEN